MPKQTHDAVAEPLTGDVTYLVPVTCEIVDGEIVRVVVEDESVFFPGAELAHVDLDLFAIAEEQEWPSWELGR